jgi:glucokinase
MKGERLILSGDIGGTKIYLALFSLHDGVLEAVREGAYQNERYEGPEEVLRSCFRHRVPCDEQQVRSHEPSLDG